jgi:hypothetical protein
MPEDSSAAAILRSYPVEEKIEFGASRNENIPQFSRADKAAEQRKKTGFGKQKATPDETITKDVMNIFD